MRQCLRTCPQISYAPAIHKQYVFKPFINPTHYNPWPPHIYRGKMPPIIKYSECSFKNLRYFSLKDSQDSNHELEEHQRILNLGSMTDRLKTLVPMLLQKSLPKALILPDVLLRICPTHFEQINSYLPNIKGHVSYYATCKATQLFLTSLVLNPRAHLHIELIRTSNFPDPNCVYTRSSKIFIRWSTCPEGCSHLSNTNTLSDSASLVDDVSESDSFSTTNAKLGSHRWSSIDAVQVLADLKRNWTIPGSISDLGKGIVGLKKDDSKLERIILGIFIFELNDQNDQVVVHTIDNLNIIERRTEENVGNKLRIC